MQWEDSQLAEAFIQGLVWVRRSLIVIFEIAGLLG